METLWQDIRFGFRMLAKNWAFTAVAVLTLALGIGANTAIFSVVYGVLLRPLPYYEPGRLMSVWQQAPAAGFNRLGLSQAQLVRLREQTRAFRDVGVYTFTRVNLTRNAETDRVLAARVSAGVLEALGVQPIVGRSFRREEELLANNNVVILGHGLWQQRFAADPSVAGQVLQVNGAELLIVGVMPAGFLLPDDLVGQDTAQLYLPLQIDPQNLNWGSYGLTAIGRLRPGVTTDTALTDVRSSFALTAQENTRASLRDSGYAAWVTPLRDDLVRDVRRALWVLLCAVGVVLLIACANVGSLQLAQASVRQQELAVRTALGAGRRRLVRQLLTESILLGLLGGAAGVLLAAWGLGLAIRLSADQIPRLSSVSLSGPVLLVTTVLSMFCALLFGLLPAFQSTRLGISGALRAEGRGTSAGLGRNRFRQALVVAQTGMAFVLVIGSGLLLHSFQRLIRISPGFHIESVLSAAINLPAPGYNDDARVTGFYDRLLQGVRSLPGVLSATVANNAPLSGSGGDTVFDIEGRPTAQEQMARGEKLVQHFFYRQVAPGYFETLSIPVLQGRSISEKDHASATRVIVINQTMARKFWPGENPLGKRMRLYWSPEQTGPWAEVIGVVGDTRIAQLTEEAQPEGFMALAQGRAVSNFSANTGVLLVRTAVDPHALAGAIRSEVRSLDSLVPVFRIRTLEESLALTVTQPRFNLTLFGLFASVALILAAAGLYGILSTTVRQRTHEIGIRMALGAQSGEVLGMILRQGLTLAGIGVAAGMAGALAVTPLMKNMLYEIAPTDTTTFIVVTMLLVFVALAASYVPARRASRVDPMIALRYE